MDNISRRAILKGLLAGTAVIAIPDSISALAKPKVTNDVILVLKGNINHSVARWCFGDIEIETLCSEAKKIGISGIDLVGPKDWPILKKHNLISAMCNGA